MNQRKASSRKFYTIIIVPHTIIALWGNKNVNAEIFGRHSWIQTHIQFPHIPKPLNFMMIFIVETYKRGLTKLIFRDIKMKICLSFKQSPFQS